MADNQFNIKIVVTDNGGTKLAEKNIRQLGAAVERVGRQHKETSREAGDYYDKQAKGIIGTANSTRSFSKLAATMNSSSGIVGAYAELAANIFAVTAAFNALRNAAQVEQIFKGLEAAGVRTGLALNSTAKSLRAVTGDAISTEQAMRSTAQIISAGFDGKSVERLGQAARDTAFALGRNMTDSLDRLSRGIVKLEPELLDELGIMTKLTESNRAYALSLGKTETELSGFEKRQGFMNAVLAEAELKFGGLSQAAGDSTGYDKLAATLSDLSTTTLNLLNTALLPLANILASSPIALVGVTALFASTLKNMIPGLNDAAQRTSALAQSLKEKANQEKAEISIARTAAKERMAANITRLAELDYVGNKAPKAYAKLSQAIREGSAAPEEYRKAIISLNRSISANEALMQNNPSFRANTERGQAKIQEIANLRAQASAIANLQLARSQSNYAEIESEKEVIAAKREALSARLNSAKAQATANALESASNFNLISGFAPLKQAMLSAAAAGRAHTLELINQAKAAQGSSASLSILTMTTLRLRGATVTATVAVRALGVAFLSALPMIGLIISGIGALVAIWDSMKTDKLKAVEKAYDELSEATSKARQYAEEMNRVNNSSAPIALKTAQAMIIQGNATDQIVEKYKAVLAAQKEYNSEGEKVSSGPSSFLETLGDRQAFASWALEVDKSSTALKLFAKEAENVGKIGFTGVELNDPALAATIKSLDALIQDNPKAVKEVAKLYGGFEKINQLSPDKKLKTVSEMIQLIGEKSIGGASRVEALQESFKALDDSIAKFAISALPSTPFDNVVKNFESVKNSIEELDAAGKKINSQEWKKLLAGIGDATLNFINPQTRQSLDEYQKALTIIEQNASGKLKIDSDILEAAKNTVKQHNNIYDRLRNELDVTNELFKNAQAATILDQSRGALLNARLNSLKTIYGMTGAGLAAQFKQEEAIRTTQTNQLKIQQSLNNVQISNIQASIDLAVKENERLIIAEKLKKTTLEQLLIQYQMIKIISGLSSEEAIGNVTKQIDELNNKIVDLEKSSERTIEKGAAQVRTIRLANEALSNQIATILEAAPTAAEKIAQIAVLNVKNNNELLNNLIEQRNSVLKTSENYSEINDIINGTTDSISSQIRIINQQYEKQRVETKRQTDAAILTAKANLDSVKATAARAGVDSAAAKAAVALAQQQVSLAETEQNIQLKLVKSEYEKSIASKVYFDTAKEGLEWQKTSLDYMQKELDTLRSLQEGSERLYQTRIKLEYKRAGLEISEEATNALEIRTATQAYKLAVDEVSLKKSLIDLEYALLAAQRDQLIEELKIRRSSIDASDPRNYTRISQIDNTLEKLGRVDIDTLAENAKTVLDQQVKAAKLDLQTAITKNAVPTAFSEIISSMRGLSDQREAKKEAEEILKNLKPKNSEIIVKTDSEAQKQAMSEITNPIIESNKVLVTSINKWINTIETILKTSQTNLDTVLGPTTSGGRVLTNIKEAFDYANKNGFIAAELKGVTRVGRHSKNSAHYDGKAFDVNLPGFQGKNWEANNKIASQKMDELAAFYRSQGFKVLWKVEDHFNHMHVEITDAVDKSMVSTSTAAIMGIKATTESVKNAEESAKMAIDTANKSIESATVTSAQTIVETPKIIEANNDNEPIIVQATLSTPPPKDYSSIEEALTAYKILTNDTIESLKQLGPEGEAVAAVFNGMESIVQSGLNAIKIFDDLSSTTSDKFTAIAGVIGSALSTVQSALAASAQAKEQSIQREIDAEQKRDGKSAESVAKIAALEKRKDEIAKKQFNTNKKLMMAQAVIGTAAGIAQALGSLPPPASIIMAGLIGAMGAAQLAIIAGTQYQSATASSANTSTDVPTLNIGKRGDTVDLAKQNNNLGGEIGYLRGSRGIGSNSSNYAVIGSAYGGELPRGYGSSAYVVGEKGPETITPETPITVRPSNDNTNGGTPLNATFNINAIDSKGVVDVLNEQKGNIISMLREAANANGQRFLEDVDINVYTRPNVSRL